MRAVDFLEEVYDGCEGWIDLPSKVAGKWIPFYIEVGSNGTIGRRVASSVRDGEDIYFSVVTFSKKGRRIEDAQASSWLFADLDNVGPDVCIKAGLSPTVCWSSSPGRFQALWKLKKKVSPGTLEKLNRALTYRVGADRGGWDLTQVLRIPGTKNHKYSGKPRVRMVFRDGPVYGLRELRAKLGEAYGDEGVTGDGLGHEYSPREDWKLPARAKALLRAKDAVRGERSHRLWELECLLVEAQVPEEVIFDLVWPCVWNKHREVHTGEAQLRREIKRAILHVQTHERLPSPPPDVIGDDTGVGDEDGLTVQRSLGPVSYSRFMSLPFPAPRWLVEGVWTAESHGIIGGEPKTSKSTLALALGLSVASGRPFLGQFPVHTTGPVLVVQEENSDWVMQDRLARIAASYGLLGGRDVHEHIVSDPGLISGGRVLELDFPSELDLWLVNHAGLDLSDESCRDSLVADIERIHPVLVVLDPLYLMLGSANENESHQLRPFLRWLLELRYEYKLAIAVVHHFRKQAVQGGVATAGGVRHGQRLMGSGTIHGWVESSLYCESLGAGEDLDPTALALSVTPEFRNMAPMSPMEITLRMGEPGDLKFEAEVKGFDERDALLRVIGDGCTLNQLAQALGVHKNTARKKATVLGCTFVKKGKTTSVRVFPPGAGGGEENGGEKAPE